MPGFSDLDGLRRAVETFPDVVQQRLQAAAKTSADRVAVRAAEILRSKVDGTRTANSIRVVDESADKQYVVTCPGDPELPANLPLWLERGTVHMSARAFMRPAADEETPNYQRAMQAAAERAAADAFGA